jgi:hypothetical protein
MTPKNHPVWNKMAVPTLDTLEEAVREIKRREKIEEWRQYSKYYHTMREERSIRPPDRTDPKARLVNWQPASISP